jgi:neutral ceramidase
MNDDVERQRYTHNVDNFMRLLAIYTPKGEPRGLLNWFPVHGTSMQESNKLISGDNKGFAASAVEDWLRSVQNPAMPALMREPRSLNDNFIAAFAQGSEGDVSPNILGMFMPLGGGY